MAKVELSFGRGSREKDASWKSARMPLSREKDDPESDRMIWGLSFFGD